ncbi:MAG: hypothetical protein IKE14_11825 [Loktanella sp.]|nr:hypothetical protein [Loktanella sp.]
MFQKLKIKAPFFPPLEDAQVRSIRARNVYRRALRVEAERVFTVAELTTHTSAFEAQRTRTKRGTWKDEWNTLLVRPEVIIILHTLRERHLESTGLPLSNAEAAAALMAAGLSALADQEAFNPQKARSNA